jgi:membrane-associated phospholipid phosphatase
MNNDVAERQDALEAWARPQTLIGLTALWLAIQQFFFWFPGFDTSISQIFFETTVCSDAAKNNCGAFPASVDTVLQTIRSVTHPGPVVLAAMLLVVTLFRWRPFHGLADAFNRHVMTLVLTALVGPLLIVNMILKAYWGRPRPFQSDAFGGGLPFVPAGLPSDHCPSNCSFVSGEASMAFWLVGLGLFVPAPYRSLAYGSLVVVAAGIAMMRVAFGAHFFSDAILGGLLTLIVLSMMAMVILHLSAKSRVTDTPAARRS